MGEMADYFYDLAMREYLFDEFNEDDVDIYDEYQKGLLCWSTKDGDDILIKDMTDNHIINSKNLLEKAVYNDTEILTWIKIFNEEINKRKLNI
jgi:hypothetical protein